MSLLICWLVLRICVFSLLGSSLCDQFANVSTVMDTLTSNDSKEFEWRVALSLTHNNTLEVVWGGV